MFKELVPAGNASLVMQRRQDNDSQDTEVTQSADRSSGRIEQYTGIGIRVCSALDVEIPEVILA